MREKPRKAAAPFAAILCFILLSTIFGQVSGDGTGRDASTSLLQADAGLVGGREQAATLQPPEPLARLLDANGRVRLDTGFRGSLDVSGWKMTIGRHGEPHFVQAAESSASLQAAALPDDVYWDNRFFRTGPGLVYAIAFGADGMYIGGSFKVSGDTPINYIARWDGTAWAPLGEGLDDAVRGIAVKGKDIYVCGDFLHAGGKEAQGVAKWDGAGWSALGGGVSRPCPGCPGTITGIALLGNDVYVAGSFTTAGGVETGPVARWNGTSWSGLGSATVIAGFNGVRIAASGTDLYVSGNVFINGQLVANGIARWDGANWFALGSGVGGLVYAITTSGSDVYVGGLLENAGGVHVNNIAKWNGTSWSALGGGTTHTVISLAVSGSTVYAGLEVLANAGQHGDRIVKWDGASWSPLGSGVRYDPNDSNTVYAFALATKGTELYVGGDFVLAGGLFARGFAKWDGANWSVMGKGAGSTLDALLVSGDDLLASGAFEDVGGIPASGVARWDGANWSAIGGGVRFLGINAMAVSGNKLYVGGGILEPGGVILPDGHVTSNVAVWDGNNWSVLSGGFSGCSDPGCSTTVRRLAVIGSDLYVGGAFTKVDNVSANNIARWDGAKWSALGAGLSGQVWALAVSGTDLYVGGLFNSAGGADAGGVAKWNGSAWSSLSEGVNGGVTALAVAGNNLYVGGNFTKAGGIKARSIARWNGSEWAALGAGVEGGVFAVTINEGNVYVAGQFAKAGSVTAKDIAGWNGREWYALGSGVNISGFPGFGLALAVYKGDLYVAGIFDTAGGKPSYGIARWSKPAEPVPVPKINSASVSGKKLFVFGQNFDTGAMILINGEAQKTANDAENPSTALIAKKSGKKVKAGDKLRVKNADGTLSEEFSFSQ